MRLTFAGWAIEIVEYLPRNRVLVEYRDGVQAILETQNVKISPIKRNSAKDAYAGYQENRG